MRANLGKTALLLVVMLGLSACTGRDGGFLNLRDTDQTGPDEFGILPGKPLQTPQSYSELPEPTPGAANITDPTPKADAVAALGGNPAALSATGIPSADGALVSHAGRFGIQSGVRAELAAADAEIRQSRGLMPLWGFYGNNRYFQLYRRSALDQEAELERMRAAGIKTPSAPPPN